MIVVMKPRATKEEIQRVEARLEELGFKTHPIYGQEKTVIGAIGDKKILSSEAMIAFSGVEKILPIMKPYKRVGLELKQEKTIVKVGPVEIGGEAIVTMAGPCAVESYEQMLAAAQAVKAAGGQILRGGAFKPRTSPYAFQGLEDEGLKYLVEARTATGLPIVTETVDPRDVELVASHADMIQIGARNMQNFRLLKEVGQTGKPILLKRGLASTIEEWLMAAEYIMDAGSSQIVLCERGIRTYETSTRNTVDLSAVPVVQEQTHLPVIVDPSHGTGIWKLVTPMARAAIAAGADGLMIEVHPDPATALCDGSQSLNPDNFSYLMDEVKKIAQAMERKSF